MFTTSQPFICFGEKESLCYLTCTIFPKISTTIFFFLINQERFQGNVLFNQIFKEFSYSSNGWVITCDYLWLSKSLTQNPVYWSTIEPACRCRRQKRLVPSLGQEDPPAKEMATHSSFLSWRLPWTEEPDGLQSMGLQRVRQDWVTEHAHNCTDKVTILIAAKMFVRGFSRMGGPSWWLSW